MVYKKKGKKGSKFIGIGAGEIIDSDCKECLYKQQGKCEGRYDSVIPCMFSRTRENDTVDNWMQY